MIELQLVGVRVEFSSNNPIVLLKERDGDRYLPIWIGQPEAAAIAQGMRGQVTARPMTHDLMRDVLTELGVRLNKVNITDLRDGTFYAEIELQQNGSTKSISSRPSDAIALAVRLGVPIYANEGVMTEAAVPITDDEEQEVEKFREFLEKVNPEDFR